MAYYFSVSGWSSWTTCKPFCSNYGQQVRIRKIQVTGHKCPKLKEMRQCKGPKCGANSECSSVDGKCRCNIGYKMQEGRILLFSRGKSQIIFLEIGQFIQEIVASSFRVHSRCELIQVKQ